MFDQCPLYPQKQTLLRVIGMSALCQKRTHALQQRTSDLIALSVLANALELDLASLGTPT